MFEFCRNVVDVVNYKNDCGEKEFEIMTLKNNLNDNL